MRKGGPARARPSLPRWRGLAEVVEALGGAGTGGGPRLRSRRLVAVLRRRLRLRGPGAPGGLRRGRLAVAAARDRQRDGDGRGGDDGARRGEDLGATGGAGAAGKADGGAHRDSFVGDATNLRPYSTPGNCGNPHSLRRVPTRQISRCDGSPAPS